MSLLGEIFKDDAQLTLGALDARQALANQALAKQMVEQAASIASHAGVSEHGGAASASTISRTAERTV